MDVELSRETESSRRAVHDDLVTGQTDFFVVQDIHAFVFAQFGFGGGEKGAVVNVGRGSVAGQEGEIGFVAARRTQI